MLSKAVSIGRRMTLGRDPIHAAMVVAGRTRRRQQISSWSSSSHVEEAPACSSCPEYPKVAPATREVGLKESAGGSGAYGGGGAFVRTPPRLLPMKPGTPLTALKIFKDQDAPVVLPRSEYPEWVNRLADKDVSLAQLRKMDVKDATDKEQMRFLKLTRRVEIRAKNEASKAK